MLSKDDKKFEPAEGEFKNCKGIARFKLLPRMLRSNVNRDSKNYRKGVPRSFSIEPFYNYTDKNGNDCVIRYFKNKVQKNTGGVAYTEYTPAELSFEQDADITVVKDKSLWWFLYNHPRCTGPGRDKDKSPFFHLEDKALEASEKAKKSRMNAHANRLIWNIDGKGLDNAQAKQILQGYGYPNVEELTDDQVRGALEDKIKTPDNLTDFIGRTGGVSLEIRSTIQKAIDNKIIVFQEKKKRWAYTKPDGTPHNTLCSVPDPNNRIEILTTFLRELDREGNLEYINNVLKTADSEVSLLKCDHCDFTTHHKPGMMSHVRNKHTDKVPAKEEEPVGA